MRLREERKGRVVWVVLRVTVVARLEVRVVAQLEARVWRGMALAIPHIYQG